MTPMALVDPSHPLVKLVQEDGRYPLQAYLFLFEALEYAQTKLGFGTEAESEPLPGEEESEESEPDDQPHRHVTGQELCEAIRQYALEQFGYMARCVFRCWNIHSTSDFGEMVYNLIRIRQMRKTRQDRREDFDDVYDFETAFEHVPQFRLPWSRSA